MKGWRFFGVAVVAGVASLLGVASTTAAAPIVATMTGEQLLSCGPTATLGCSPTNGTRTIKSRCTTQGDSGSITYRATGIATGPYFGTFTESGTIEWDAYQLTRVEVNFHIDSAVADIDGRKFITAPIGSGFCGPGHEGFFAQAAGIVRYEAIIKPDTGGSYADAGTASLTVAHTGSQNPALAELETTTTGVVFETFTSSLAITQPLLPDAKEQCKYFGFLIFGVFENQGDCVSFVTTHGKNEPGQNVP